MTIRRLVPADAHVFQALRLRGLMEDPGAFASSHAEEVDRPIGTVAERLAPKPDGAVFGAFEGAALVGITGVQREGMRKLAHKAFVWGMYVAPGARCRGIGRALLERALEFAAAELRVRQVTLGVHTENEAALALYRRCGFEVFGTERDALLVDGVLQDECWMVCRVVDRPRGS